MEGSCVGRVLVCVCRWVFAGLRPRLGANGMCASTNKYNQSVPVGEDGLCIGAHWMSGLVSCMERQWGMEGKRERESRWSFQGIKLLYLQLQPNNWALPESNLEVWYQTVLGNVMLWHALINVPTGGQYVSVSQYQNGSMLSYYQH